MRNKEDKINQNQKKGKGKKILTTAAGIPVPDNQTSLTAGKRDPKANTESAEPPLKISGNADRYEKKEGSMMIIFSRAIFIDCSPRMKRTD